MEIIDRKSFFEIEKQMEITPFTQGKGWDNYIGNKSDSLYFVDNYSNPSICCRGELYNKPFIGSVLRIQGEAVKQPKQETIQNFYKGIAQIGYSLVLISSLSPYDIEYEIGIREAGFIRPLHQTTCPLTILINTLDRPAGHRSWKRNIKKAIAAKCSFQIISQPTLKDCETFVRIFEEMATKKQLSYILNKQNIYNLLQDPDYKLFFVYSATGSIIAGRIIYINGKHAWDVFAANSNESRENGASYFIIENILDYLSNENINFFDFGRIGPGLTNSNQVYLFKQSSGGYPIPYNGEWIFAKNKINELLMLTYRYILKKGIRY